EELYPVRNSERDCIGLPCVFSPRRVVQDPISNQETLILTRTMRIMQIIKIVQVIPPELRHILTSPIRLAVRRGLLLLQEDDCFAIMRLMEPMDARHEPDTMP